MTRRRGGPLTQEALGKLEAVSDLWGRPPTLTEVAQATEEPRVTWRKRVTRGNIVSVKLQGKLHIPMSALMTWVAQTGGAKSLEDSEVRHIRARVATGSTLDDIQSLYPNVARYTLKRVIDGKTYNGVK